MTYVPSEDLDQPGYLTSLTSLHCLPDENLGPWLPTECQAENDKTVRAVQTDLSLHKANIIL